MQLSTGMANLAQDSGLQFEVFQTLDAGKIDEAMRVIIYYRPEMDVAPLASAHPMTQFVAMTDMDLQPTANLTVLNSSSDSVLFAGGYLSMLIATDWRVVGLIPTDTNLGTGAAWAFFNGGGYFCGRCSPLSPPYAQFPLLINLPAASNATDWELGYQAIESNRFNVAFVDGLISNPEVYIRLAERGLVLLGSGMPPAAVENIWAATVQQDMLGTIETIWPDLIIGKAAGKHNMMVTLTNVNSALLGDGKIQLFNEMADELFQGLISTSYQPTN